jgi:hypothetical protein
MSKALRTTFVVIGVVVAVSAVLLTGMAIGRSGWGMFGFGPGNMMGGFGFDNSGAVQMPFGSMMDNDGGSGQYGYSNGAYGNGMMGSGTMGYGMMGPSMMGSGTMGYAMMGNYSPSLVDVDPIILEDAEQAVNDYLSKTNSDDLILGEIMIFDNHAYAQIIEESTGIGAMEVLIDPVNLEVYPEFGPNMTWNSKYGMMSGNSGFGMMGGMMNGFQQVDPAAEMTVTVEDAVNAAQEYLDDYLPGAIADDHADQFYGYYTLHIEKDGAVIGMLSVNGYTEEVFLHTWHGDLVEMSAK